MVLKPCFSVGADLCVRPLFMNPALGILFLIGRDSPPSFRRMLVTTARLARAKVKRPAPGVSVSRVRAFRDDGRKPHPPEIRMRENTQVLPYKPNPNAPAVVTAPPRGCHTDLRVRPDFIGLSFASFSVVAAPAGNHSRAIAERWDGFSFAPENLRFQGLLEILD